MPILASLTPELTWLTGVYIAAALILLLMNAFFVLAEFAIVKVRLTRLEMLSKKGSKGAQRAQVIVEKTNEYLSACQLGITLASLGLGWLGEPAFGNLFEHFFKLTGLWGEVASHTAGGILAFALITAAHIIIGELAPKQLAIQRPERMAIAVSWPMRFFYYVFLVPLWTMNQLSTMFLRLLRLEKTEDTTHSEEELRILMSRSESHGVMPLNSLLLFENLFDFGTLTVRDAMLPIERARTLSADAPWEDNLKVIRESKFSRYPVRKGDQFIGKIHIKDLVLTPGVELAKILRPIPSLNVDLPLEAALRELQRTRVQFALAAEAGGKIVGLITMEDILEELVGSIMDEFEHETQHYLAEILISEGIRLNLTTEDKMQALREIMSGLSEKDLGCPPEKAVKAVIDREQAVSTNLGGGIAIPHGRLSELKHPLLMLGRSTKGIPFDPDGEPVRLIFILLSPAGEPHVQVRVLARIAGMLHSEYVRERLLVIDDPKEIKDVIRAADPHSLS